LEVGFLCRRTKCFKGAVYCRFEDRSFVILGIVRGERGRGVNEIVYAFDSFVECAGCSDVIDDYELGWINARVRS